MVIRWRLRDVMARYGVKGTDLAVDLGVSAESVSRLRNRSTMPTLSPDRLNGLLTALNKRSRQQGERVGVSDLIDWRDDEVTP